DAGQAQAPYLAPQSGGWGGAARPPLPGRPAPRYTAIAAIPAARGFHNSRRHEDDEDDYGNGGRGARDKRGHHHNSGRSDFRRERDRSLRRRDWETVAI
ncbi:unnamed protein product, partial [Urochloa humidicola]